jgi:hypothetical protein
LTQSNFNRDRLPDAASARPLDFGGLTIIMDPAHGWAHYIGTRMQLEAEGIIPGEPCWPDGFTRADKEANGIHFTLKRERPEGAKGPLRDFIDCDNWCLTMRRVDAEPWDARQIRLKAKELQDMVYRQTRAWSDECDRRHKLYYTAQEDEKFQAFKALIPGLIPPPKPRGRRPKSATQSQGGDA